MHVAIHQASRVLVSNYLYLFQTRVFISVVGQSLGSNITQKKKKMDSTVVRRMLLISIRMTVISRDNVSYETAI